MTGPALRQRPAVLDPGAIDRARSAPAAAALWSHRVRDLEHVRDGATFTYRFTDAAAGGGAPRYLRLTPPGWESRERIEAELTFVDCARAAGVHAPEPLPSRRGARVEAVDGPTGPLLACVFTAAPGATLAAPAWTVDHARAFGAMLGRLHVASAGCGVAPGARPGWRDDLATIRAWLAPEERTAHAALDDVERTLAGWPAGPAEYGLVHDDAGSSNLLWDGMTPWLLDFDDCCFHWYAADVANALDTLRDHPDRRALGRAFLAAYREQRPFDDAAVARLPVLVRLRSVGALAWLTRSRWVHVEPARRTKLEAAFRAAIADPPPLL